MILHGPVEISGQVGLSVLGLREIGHEAYSVFGAHPFAYELQPDFRLVSGSVVRRTVDRLLRIIQLTGKFDVYHYHFARSLLPDGLAYADARLNRHLGRKVVVEFWGSDVRMPSIERVRNPYYVRARDEDDASAERRMELWARITGGHVVIADHSLDVFVRRFFSRVHVVRQRVDTQALQPNYPDPEQKRPVLVHIPSDASRKGTAVVRRVVERLRAKRIEVEYLELSGVTHRQALAACARADLVVDQVLAGSHGVFAVEAMALGKPVICYVLPELIPTYPEGFPIINANPDTLDAVLEEWLQLPEKRYLRGIQSREYAERVHDVRVVARRLVEVYRQLPEKPQEQSAG